MQNKQNIFTGINLNAKDESFEDLITNSGFRLEKIISTGQTSQPDFWYDQEESEWVIVISGSAALEFENEPELIELTAGDYLLIPAHKKHRVARTESPTVWLALFY